MRRFLIRFLIIVLALPVLFIAWNWIKDPVLTQRLLTLDQGPEDTVKSGAPLAIANRPPEQRLLSAAAIDAAIDYGESTGSHALLVFHRGAIELEHYYPGHTADTLTPTQSMHKSVLAIVTGIAIAEGHIDSVNAPVGKWIHEWQDDARGDITIRQLLQQTSGIDYSTFSTDLTSPFYQIMLGTNIRPYALNNDILFPADTEFDYTSVNPLVLGIVIERATGQRYSDYLSAALWQKIGAPEARVVIDSAEHGMARTFCCLQATARSWLHLGLLHLNRGEIGGRRIVSREWMRAVATPGELQPNYGYLT
ncbi:MAG: beta-lactamase family protein, partial [Gammaproteobacteria bacterium]|nr:beta-lactamase family protein [Gammaproteobacteria bacterium]